MPSTTWAMPASPTPARLVLPGPGREGWRHIGGFPFPYRLGSACSIEMPGKDGHRRKRDQFRIVAASCRAACRGEQGCCG